MPQVDHLEKKMPLSSYNVNQQLVTRFQQLFTHTPIPYVTLKSYIVSRKPLDQIHQTIVAELKKLEMTDKEEAQANLESKALEKQSREDKEEQRRDERDHDRQESDKVRLISEHAVNSSFRFQLETELRILEQQIAFRKAQEAATHKHEHAHPSETANQAHSHPSETTDQTHAHSHPSETTGQTHNHSHPSETTGQTHNHSHPSTQTPVVNQPDPNILKAQNIRQQLSGVGLRLIQINSSLAQIEEQARQRKENRIQRDERIEAQLKLAQHKSGANIFDALSSSNRKDLKNQISSALDTLSLKCTSLINNAMSSNYAVFIQQLESSLYALNYSSQEKEALGTILNLMKQHQVYTEAADTIQAQLSNTINAISSYKDKLQRAQARVQLLKQAHPNLIRENEGLATKNAQLEVSKKENLQTRDKFSTPTWILAGVALVTSIPLILALSGVLAVTMAPVLFFTLLSIIPALSLATSIGLGITALVYGIKGSGNGKDITTNEKTIQANINQMGRNQTELNDLQTLTIPNYIQTINLDGQSQIKQEALLQEKRTLAQQALQQAQMTEPMSSLYPHLPSSHADVPPPYEATNRNAFFSLVPYQPSYMPEPSAPPIELMDDTSSYSYH